MSQDKELLSIYSDEAPYFFAFTENDVFKKMDLTSASSKELKDYIQPNCLKVVSKIFGVNSDTQESSNSQLISSEELDSGFEVPRAVKKNTTSAGGAESGPS